MRGSLLQLQEAVARCLQTESTQTVTPLLLGSVNGVGSGGWEEQVAVKDRKAERMAT